jgi:hypothetical protein
VPNFYQRPLTWLFWIAALSLDAVALSIDYEGRLASALVLGQLFVVSGWLAVGRSPLVIRAACLVAAVALITAPDYVIPRWRSDMHRDVVWPHVLAMTMVGAAITAMATASWAALLRGASPLKEEGAPPTIRFSVASCLGWMLVVAVASSALRVADFSLLLDQPFGVLSGVGMAGVAASLIAGALADYRATAITRVLNVMAILVMALLIAFDLRPPMASPEKMRAAREALPVLWGCLAFVGAWIFVMRLDGRRCSTAASAIAHCEPQLDHCATPALRLFADER